jgi:hypothetical protein
VAKNAYGGVFMLKKSFGDDIYLLYLAAISFFSAPNSQFFKLITVPYNENCFALNQDSYFESTPEDQIAVSYICNDMLYIYRVCMRPNVVIDFHNYINKATDNQGHQGIMQFNDFYVKLSASNEYNVDKENVADITVHFLY